MAVNLILRNLAFASCLSLAVGLPWAQDRIVLIHPAGKHFEEAIAAIRQSIGEELRFESRQISKGDTWNSMQSQLSLNGVRAFVLLDNQAVTLYRQYVEQSRKHAHPVLPAVALMALQLENISQDLPLLGISYEIPVVTSVVNLRSVSRNAILKIGVLHRKSWESFIKKQAEFCLAEQVQLVGYSLPDDEGNLVGNLGKGLKELLSSQKVDALWILNDNALLTSQTLSRAWIPGTGRSSVPIIVGVETLVQSQFNFGSFAVLPDHTGLGSQAADMIFDLMDRDWQQIQPEIDQPLSVKKILNTSLARRKRWLNEKGLHYIDQEVQ